MFDKAINFIYNFDIIGPTPKLYIFNKERYQSIFSLILSILIIILSLIFIIYTIINYIENDRPNVVYSKSNDDNEKRNINLNDILIMIQIVDVDAITKLNESIVQLQSLYTAIYDNASVEHSALNVKPCIPGENMNIKYQDYLREKFNGLTQEQIQGDKNINDFYCINSDNHNISLFYYPNIGYSYIDLNIILQNQSLYTPEDISLMMVYQNNIINHDNKESPISTGISYQFLQVFSSIEYYLTNFNFQYLKYETDDGIFFNSLKYLKGMSFLDLYYYKDNQVDYDLKKNFIKYNSSQVGTIRFNLNKSNYDFYRRTYKKIQALLAEIMSVISLLFEIGRQILSFLNEKKMSVDIIRALFKIDNKKRKYKHQNFDDRIQIVPEKINNSFKSLEKNSISIEGAKIMNEESQYKNDIILKKIYIYNIIKSFICNGPKDKIISLSHQIIIKDMCVETILEKFYNLGRIYKSIIDIEKYNLGLIKEPRFREINSLINDIHYKNKKWNQRIFNK